MSWSRPVDPALAVYNPAGYRARIRLMEIDELLRHLRCLTHEQICRHVRVMLPDGALARGARAKLDLAFRGKQLTASFDFAGPHGSGHFYYRDGFPSTVHAAVLAAVRELLREARMALLDFAITFEFQPFSLVPLEGFVDVCRQLAASEIVPVRLTFARYPESSERGIVNPPFAMLFADLTTDRDETVQVTLALVEPPGWQERLLGWARQRAAELGVPIAEVGP